MGILTLLIPEERRGVLIGKAGSVKKEIERKTGTAINISPSGVEISGEGIGLLTARDIVQAIGRGFSPEASLLLLDEDYQIDIISMSGETKNTTIRLFARVIGKQGRVKRAIEEATECSISVYGKTISIIGRWDRIPEARRCIELLLEGKEHSTVRGYLKRKE